MHFIEVIKIAGGGCYQLIQQHQRIVTDKMKMHKENCPFRLMISQHAFCFYCQKCWFVKICKEITPLFWHFSLVNGPK